MLVLSIALYDRFGGLSGDEKPLARVGQVFVFDGQVFCQYALAFGQPVSIRAEQLIFLVLVLVVTVAGREYVVVKLHHGNHARVQQVLRVHDFGARILPKSGQHVRSVHRYVGLDSEPFLRTKQ